jgi:hypothetical protein
VATSLFPSIRSACQLRTVKPQPPCYVMADNSGDIAFISCGGPSSICNICYYPTWSIELITDTPWDQVLIDSYDKLHSSAQNGLRSACEFVVPELQEGGLTQITFPKSGVNLDIQVYIGNLVHIVDVYTLLGTSLHLVVLITMS